MRRYWLGGFFILLSVFMAMADEIHLTDGTVVRGKVVRVTDTKVSYIPAMTSAEQDTEKKNDATEEKDKETVPVPEELSIPGDKVGKIVYDSGETLTLVKKNPDKIFLYDGLILEGTVTKVAEKYIAYRTGVAGPEQVVPRDLTDKILFGTGKEISVKQQPLGDSGIPVGKDKKKTGTQPDAGKEAQADASVPKEQYRFTVGLILQYGAWNPQWRKTVIDTLPIQGPFTVETDPSFQYGVMATVRLGDRFSLYGSFLYGRFNASYERMFSFTIPIPPYPFIVNAECAIDTFDAELLLRYHLLERLYLYVGVRYMGYLKHLEYIAIWWMGFGNTGTSNEEVFSLHSAGPKIGAEYTLPLFWILSLRGNLGMGSLFGEMRDFSEGFAAALLIDLYAGVQGDIPVVDVRLNLDFYWRYLYYYAHDENLDIGDVNDHQYGVRLTAQYCY